MKPPVVVTGAFATSAHAMPSTALGAFGDATADDASSLAAEALQPPSDLVVSFRCVLLGILLPVADLTWTATPSSFAEGYVLERWKGAVLEDMVSIAGGATTSYTDGTGLSGLGLATSYTWRLRAVDRARVSTEAVHTASTPVACL